MDEFGREKRPGSDGDHEEAETSKAEATTEIPPQNNVVSGTVPIPPEGTEASNSLGLESIDFTSLDFSSPEAWLRLSEAWKVTNGWAPTQEQLMMCVMQAQMQMQAMQWGNMTNGTGIGWTGATGDQDPNLPTNLSSEVTNGMAPGAEQEVAKHPSNLQSPVEELEDPPISPKSSSNGQSGGRMIRVGDKWKWVTGS